MARGGGWGRRGGRRGGESAERLEEDEEEEDEEEEEEEGGRRLEARLRLEPPEDPPRSPPALRGGSASERGSVSLPTGGAPGLSRRVEAVRWLLGVPRPGPPPLSPLSDEPPHRGGDGGGLPDGTPSSAPADEGLPAAVGEGGGQRVRGDPTV